MHLTAGKYFGKARLSLQLKNYFLSISEHSVQDEIPHHFHDNSYISLNLGSAYLEINETCEELVPPGKILFRSSRYEHQNRFEQADGLCFNIELTSSLNAEVLSLFKKMEYTPGSLGLFKIMAMAASNCKSDLIDRCITQFLLENSIKNHSFQHPQWYQRIIQKVQTDYHFPLSLSVLAEFVELHPNYLARKFRQLSGWTIGEYIRRVRMEKACLNLRTSTRLTDVAFESGYYDQPHFSNAFRSTFGISPKELQYFLAG